MVLLIMSDLGTDYNWQNYLKPTIFKKADFSSSQFCALDLFKTIAMYHVIKLNQQGYSKQNYITPLIQVFNVLFRKK